MHPIMRRDLARGITRLLILLLVCVGCVPAKTPDQLTFTPGAALIIADRQIDFGFFKLTYPADWRVITSAAENSPGLILAAPEDAGLILITLNETPSPGTLPPDMQVVTEAQVEVSGNNITLWLVTDQTHQSEFESILQQIIASITPHNL